jgi:hypothetical protein
MQVQIDRSSRLQTTLGESVTADGSPCEAARLLPTLALPVDVFTASLAAQVIVLEPTTGEVLALVGDAAPGLDPARLPVMRLDRC